MTGGGVKESRLGAARWGLVGLLLGGGLAAAQGAAPVTGPGPAEGASPGEAAPRIPATEVLALTEGRQVTLNLPALVRRVAVGDPEVADVAVISARSLLVTPRTLGRTSLLVWMRGRSEPSELMLRIGPAIDLEAELGEAELTVETTPAGLRVSGEASSLAGHNATLGALAREGLALVDDSRMGFPTQVQTDIKIVEVSRSKLKSFGAFFGRNRPNTTLSVGGAGTLAGVEAADGFTLLSGSGFLPEAQAFNIVAGNFNKGVLGVISALEGSGFAHTLAEPSLVSLSGQSATFLAGGEFPIPVVQGGSTSSSITIEYKEFGVRLTLTPTVLAADQIMLRVAPEVSELDFNAGVSTGGVTVPALRVRRTETTVELGDGESFVISGLISQNTLTNVDKLPGLGDLPVLGALFRSSQIEREDRELMMVVTPHLVRPLARDAQLPPLPGAAMRGYDPGFAEFVLEEDGDFDFLPPLDIGFSE